MSGLAAVDISMLGDKALVRKVSRFIGKKQRRIVSSAMRKAMKQIVLPQAIADAPVDTGRHQANIRVRAIRKRGRRDPRIGVEVRSGTRAQLGIPAGYKWYYPAILEFKTDPHLIPALEDNRERVLGRMRTEVGRGIERELSKGANRTAGGGGRA